MHTDPLVQAHCDLLTADSTYAELPSPANHLAVLRAQRVYYALLRQQYRRSMQQAPSPKTTLYAEQWVRRAQIILERARLNLARRKDSPRWQEIALHQYRRARRVLMRAQAQADLMRPPTTPTRTRRNTPPTPRRKRVPHPITRRWVYVEED
jgi:hypothetical protein